MEPFGLQLQSGHAGSSLLLGGAIGHGQAAARFCFRRVGSGASVDDAIAQQGPIELSETDLAALNVQVRNARQAVGTGLVSDRIDGVVHALVPGQVVAFGDLPHFAFAV